MTLIVESIFTKVRKHLPETAGFALSLRQYLCICCVSLFDMYKRCIYPPNVLCFANCSSFGNKIWNCYTDKKYYSILMWKKLRVCVWEQERQRDYCVWLCESRCRHLLESWSPARGCYNMQGCHTRTNSTVIFKLCVHVKTTAGQTLLFILMTPPQSQMQPDINTWPSAKHTVPHQCLCLCQPIARRAKINPAILLHSPHTHSVQ